MARVKNLGLTYLRRSTEKQEISLVQQLEWAINAAAHHGAILDAAPTDLAHMQTGRLHTYKGIRLDDGITGSDMNRPGFRAVLHDIFADPRNSHLFIYQRDRLARPDEAMEMVQVEKKIREAGVTIVFVNSVSEPYAQGQQDIGRDLGIWFGYYESGEFLRKHAERVLEFQKRLAREGYRTGGNPPYGFVRVLVDGAGNVLETLPAGKTVQQTGCHVRVIPADFEKIAVWLRILEMKETGWGVKRIAVRLNELGIPSPDAGRTRTDHGVKHRVSGKWSHNTVAELCRNPIILGRQQYGVRSEGKLRRLGSEGPRLLGDKDRTASGGPRVIMNAPELHIVRHVGKSQFDEERWRLVQQQMEERGQNQRGIQRAKEPAKYPLACRVVDLSDGCGSILYGRTSQGRPIYTCGRYMRTSGAQCASNSVDAEALLRFTLKTLRQIVDRHGNREKLRALLLERARRNETTPAVSSAQRELAALMRKQQELGDQLAVVRRRMSLENDDSRYEAIAAEFDRLSSELRQTEAALSARQAAQPTSSLAGTPEQQADEALALLDDTKRVADNAEVRAEVNPMLRRLGVWIGLSFAGEVKGKKRVVQRLQSGVMTFGERGLPVPLFGRDNLDGKPSGTPATTLSSNEGDAKKQSQHQSDALHPLEAGIDVDRGDGRREYGPADGKETPTPSAGCGDRSHPVRLCSSRPEGISTTKVSRGKRI